MDTIRANNIKIIRFLVASLDKSFRSYYKKLSVAKFMFSEVSVHNLRISMRRAIAICSIINYIIPNYYSVELTKHLRKKMKVLNELRDIQVGLLKIEQSNLSGKGVSELRQYLIEQEHKNLIKAKRNISSFFDKDINSLIFLLRIRILDCMNEKTDLKGNLIGYINDRYYSLKIKFREVKEDNFRSFHQLRLEFKKYRYSIEQMINYMEKKTVLVKRLKHFQDLLGRIQDNTVFCNKIEKYISEIKHKNSAARLNLIPLIKKIEDDRNNAMNEIYTNKKLFYSLNSANFIRKIQ